MERLQRLSRAFAEVAADIAAVAHDGVAENHRRAGHAHRRQAELLDQLLERIGAETRVVVQLRHASLVGHAGRGEALGDDLAAYPAGGFKQRDVAQVGAVLFEQVRGQ